MQTGMSAKESSAHGELVAPGMPYDLAPSAAPALAHKAIRIGSHESAALALARSLLRPLAVTISLAICMLIFRQPLSAKYVALGLLAFLFSQQLLGPLDSQHGRGGTSLIAGGKLWHLLFGWMSVLGALTTLGLLLSVTQLYPRSVIFWWFGLTPVVLLLANHLGERATRQIRTSTRRHVIVGADGLGAELARRIELGADHGTFMGFFDFRSSERLSDIGRHQLVGHCRELADFVRDHAVDTIYIALPMSNAPRIDELLRELRDTTASIYFVPNVFAFDLIQSRCIEINGMAAISICDTPFHGMNAVHKRLLDLALASVALLLTWPLMLLLAIVVRLSSPGPIIFKQRRHGLHGEEIVVYKYRTMTVCEDAERVAQAVRDDKRITSVGRVLRRASLDELPQIFNVLRGTMSFVGPRPHALTHNEQYRRVISGYMIRHKIRPGITGWAQINGYRGETDTLEKMRRRVACDIEYLKNWSIWLDVKIVVRTILMVFDDRNAY
jgi:putative colanic acid biosynthesis UDP-glucose lipid carrier transferase